jgi:hypothetical protein
MFEPRRVGMRTREGTEGTEKFQEGPRITRKTRMSKQRLSQDF